MSMTTPTPRPPAQGSNGPATSVAVKFESYFARSPFTARIEVRALTEGDALERLDAGYALARRQLLALITPAVTP